MERAENKRPQESGRQRESAPETETVGDRAAENRQEPNHAAEDAGQRAGCSVGKFSFSCR